ncbi:MAG TPA: sortase [Candidatus Limnocylindrales bacterium]|jgi:hypothetical protein
MRFPAHAFLRTISPLLVVGVVLATTSVGSAPSAAPADHAPSVVTFSRPAVVEERLTRTEPGTIVSPARPVADRSAILVSIPQPQARVRAEVTPASATAVRAAAASKPRPAAPAYRGRNHVWIPSLGISRNLAWFSCSRSTPPGNRLYQWGCAGRNNVYVFAHAYSVFRPLHDAYAGGRLRKGMKVVYADGRGRIHTYRVRYWRVVSPVGADWAYAAQSQPSMTLQTCVGARSQHRLVVRLTEA